MNTPDYRSGPAKKPSRVQLPEFESRRRVRRTPMYRPYLVLFVWAAAVAANVLWLPRKYAMHVQEEKIQVAPMPLIVRASGNLEAKLSLTAKSQFEGPVTYKGFREGQKVRKGQLLFVMSRERIQLDYQTKFDALQNARADLLKARKDLRMQKDLYEKQAVAYSSVEDAQTDLTKKTQALSSAKEAFNLELLQWNNAKIYAPFDGTVVKDFLGDDKFAKSDKELFMIADVSEYTVKARVDELDIKQVHEGQKATVTLQIYPDTPMPAFVKEVGSAPEGNGLPEVPVVLSLPDTMGLQLRPKLTAECRIFTGVTEPILSVPLDAVLNTDGEPRVWQIEFLDKIHAVPVTLGRMSPDRVEVTQGLQAGARVCVSAEPEFADGMRVVIGAPDKSGVSKTHALMKALIKDQKPGDDRVGRASRGPS